MRRALVLVVALLAAAPCAVGEEPAPEARAFVTWNFSRVAVWAGEPFLMRLRLGVDRVWFDEHAVPLHAQRMDLPVELDAHNWPALPGITVLADLPKADPGQGASVRLVLGGAAVEGRIVDDEVRDGRTFRVVEVERRVSVAQPGPLLLPATSLRFAHAARFATDAFGARIPVDRTETVVSGPAGGVFVRPLPTEGRPADFAGAVGRFTLEGSVDRTEVRESEPFRFTLVMAGEGNLETLVPPPLDASEDFHVFGVLDDHGLTQRTLTYEVAARRSPVNAVVGAALSFFDPGPPAGYETVDTAPISLTVRSGARVPDIGNETTCDFGPGPRVPPWAIALTAGVFVGLLAAAWARVRRSRRRRSESPNLVRRRTAMVALRAAAARPGTELAPAFSEVLAAHLAVPRAAAVGTDIAGRLARSGVATDVAARAAAILERLVAARYGGEPAGAELAAEALALADGLSPR